MSFKILILPVQSSLCVISYSESASVSYPMLYKFSLLLIGSELLILFFFCTMGYLLIFYIFYLRKSTKKIEHFKFYIKYKFIKNVILLRSVYESEFQKNENLIFLKFLQKNRFPRYKFLKYSRKCAVKKEVSYKLYL